MNSRFIILLAAGKSSRMGIPKGLMNYNGQPWLEEQINRLCEMETAQIILVLGFQVEEYLKQLLWLKEAIQKPVRYRMHLLRVSVNEQPERGPFSSLIQGLQFTEGPLPKEYFILPIDVPCPHPRVWKLLHESLISPTQVALPSYKGRGGHPVLLAPSFLDKLRTISFDSTEARLDHQVRLLDPRQVQRIEVEDPQIRMNINSPEEWTRYCDSLPEFSKK